nr:hypothetical protein [Tanacetum cinerariifolium]
MSYFAAFVTLQSARARVIALALGVLGCISLIGLFLSRSQVVCFRDILPLERWLVVSGDVIRLSFAIKFSFRIGSPMMYLSTFSVSLDMNFVQIKASSWKRFWSHVVRVGWWSLSPSGSGHDLSILQKIEN